MAPTHTSDLDAACVIAATRATDNAQLARHLGALLRSRIPEFAGSNRALVTDMDGRLIAACGPDTSGWEVLSEVLSEDRIREALTRRQVHKPSTDWGLRLPIFDGDRPVGTLSLAVTEGGGQFDQDLVGRVALFASVLGRLLGQHHLIEHNDSLVSVSPEDPLTGLPFLSSVVLPEKGWAMVVDLRELQHYNDKQGMQDGDRAILRLVQNLVEASTEISEQDHRERPVICRGDGAQIVLVTECPDGLYLTRIALAAKGIFSEDPSGLLFLAGIAKLNEDGTKPAHLTVATNKAPTLSATESRVIPVL